MAEIGTAFLNPERVVSYFDIPKGGVVADFGAGSGFYSVPLARKVGAEGKVYAFDILPHAVDQIRSNAKMLRLLQLDAVRADLEAERGSRLKDASTDFVLVASILHQADDKSAVLNEAARILKPGRTMAVIEWDQSPAPGGPPMELRLTQSKVKELANTAGFIMDREFEAGSHHFGILFKKR
ncbi:MAG: class I SAM-dependent methyltransferase [Candidatus Sungbacteria bacterium]|nr:class I SAM-dependent methyltransferase [Candidatus Sungbacteria bacterium]